MRNPYDVLGIPHNSTKDQARTAYRALAMKYHPDRNIGAGAGRAEEMFKEIKAAWEAIEAGYAVEQIQLSTPPKRSAPAQSSFGKQSWSKPEFTGWQSKPFTPQKQKPQRPAAPKPPPMAPDYRENDKHIRIIEAQLCAPAQNSGTPSGPLKGEFIARVSICDALAGFIVEVSAQGEQLQIDVPPGAPHNLPLSYDVAGGHVKITTMIKQSTFTIKNGASCLREQTFVGGTFSQVIRSGELSTVLEVTTSNLYYGATFDLTGPDGKLLKVVIPRGTKNGTKIKIPEQGYYDWYPAFKKGGDKRQDLYVQVMANEFEYVQNGRRL